MDRRLPPIAQLGVGTLVLSLIAAIVITSNIPTTRRWRSRSRCSPPPVSRC